MEILHSWRAAAVLAVMLAVASPYGWAGESEPATHRVEIRQFKFVPETLNVKPGDAIVWVNIDIVPHTVTALDGSWDSGNIDIEAEWHTIVVASMSGKYYCRYHPAMTGAVGIDIRHSSMLDSNTDLSPKRK